MIRSIVVAIDSSESSKQAQAFALKLAKRFDATVTGIAVLDTPWIKRPMAMPIGAGHYRAHRDKTLIANQRKELSAKLAAFDQLCAKESIQCRMREVEGEPCEMLDQEAEQHDLIILGRQTNFHGVDGQDIGEITDALLRDHPRPVVVVPPSDPLPGSGVVIGFDGSLPAGRAMHMFYLLGLANDQQVHVVSVSEESSSADDLAARGANFFRQRGVEAVPHAIHTDQNISEALFDVVRSVGADMAAIGAFGRHSIWHQLLVGSTTKAMIRSCPVPLFAAY
jgi:nucleotide-binding universal stress UspA family protein